mmetsp:Transcript_53759/g.149151  ORF Transcript_53759/g.149151 Transcript_53759/m.149151 type:complete len:215 (+) Transcript_53759:2026-2670(+)
MPSCSCMLAPTGSFLACSQSNRSCKRGKSTSLQVNAPQGPKVCQFISKIHASRGKELSSNSSTSDRTESLSKLNQRVNNVPSAHLGGTGGPPAACTKSRRAPAKSRPWRKTERSRVFREAAYQPSLITGMPVSFTTAQPSLETKPQVHSSCELSIGKLTLSWQFRFSVSAPLSSVRAVPRKFPISGSSPQRQTWSRRVRLSTRRSASGDGTLLM